MPRRTRTKLISQKKVRGDQPKPKGGTDPAAERAAAGAL